MKSTVFVRPNLKGFLVGAILLLVVQHIITTGQGQARPVPVNARELTSSELLQFGARQFAGVDRDGPGLALTGGDDVLDHQQEDGSYQETFKIRSDKYRALHSFVR